jgi:hypothetical protein
MHTWSLAYNTPVTYSSTVLLHPSSVHRIFNRTASEGTLSESWLVGQQNPPDLHRCVSLSQANFRWEAPLHGLQADLKASTIPLTDTTLHLLNQDGRKPRETNSSNGDLKEVWRAAEQLQFMWDWLVWTSSAQQRRRQVREKKSHKLYLK